MGKSHQDRVAVITGAGGGLGRVFAERLASEGCHVAVTDVQPVDDAVAAVKKLGRKCYGEICDLAQPSDIARFAANVLKEFGRCDILVNNAAYMPLIPFEELDLKAFQRFEAVNVEASFLLVKAFSPGMEERGFGRIVNIASSTTQTPMPGFLGYITTKMAAIGLTRALAAQFGDKGIVVNALSPGLTRTENSVKHLPQAQFDAVRQQQLIKRTEEPDDLAGVLVFLTSEDAKFVTGQTYHVDGGVSF